MKKVVRATMIDLVSDSNPDFHWKGHWIEVTTCNQAAVSPRWKACIPKFRIMCNAIMSDTQNPSGSGAELLTALHRIDSGHSKIEELGGNAWYKYISHDRVWFEGLHGQEGDGEVSFLQFKTAVETYIQFLNDPEHKTIEIELPEI